MRANAVRVAHLRGESGHNTHSKGAVVIVTPLALHIRITHSLHKTHYVLSMIMDMHVTCIPYFSMQRDVSVRGRTELPIAREQ